MHDLSRFKDAQKEYFDIALSEIRAGEKSSHWIWFIFPQLSILGYSTMAKYYGISSKSEAKAYIKDPLLRENLITISNALLSLKCNDALIVMGYPDNLKLQSSMTLFSIVEPEVDVFSRVLDKFFDGKRDENTVSFLLKDRG